MHPAIKVRIDVIYSICITETLGSFIHHKLLAKKRLSGANSKSHFVLGKAEITCGNDWAHNADLSKQLDAACSPTGIWGDVVCESVRQRKTANKEQLRNKKLPNAPGLPQSHNWILKIHVAPLFWGNSFLGCIATPFTVSSSCSVFTFTWPSIHNCPFFFYLLLLLDAVSKNKQSKMSVAAFTYRGQNIPFNGPEKIRVG